MTEIALLDTHVVIWWLQGRKDRLGPAARRFVDAVDEGRAVACIATLSLVEIGEAARKGKVKLAKPLGEFVADLEAASSQFLLVPFTPGMAVRAHDLYAIPERADRLIAATALELGYPLVTRDPEIVAAFGGEHVW